MASPDVTEQDPATPAAGAAAPPGPGDRPARRLVGLLRPHRSPVALALLTGVAGIALNAVGPLLLGRVTDLVAVGVLGPGGPGGDAAGSPGPATGVDFASVGRLLLVLLVVYVGASLFTLAQGRIVASVVWRVIHDLRGRAQAKLSRLPLRHYDRHPAGETLGRTTNDVDNLQQTLQQTLAELITSILSLVAMLTLMVVISPSLAVVMILSVPVSGLLATWLGRRAHPQFTAQWEANGALNAHVEEVCTGHALIRGHHRRAEAQRRFAECNDAVYRAGASAQTSSGAMEPVMMFVANLGYLVVAVVGAWKVLSGSLTLGDVQAFILYARQFSQPIVEIASVAGRLQSGVASAKRVFTLLDAPEQEPEPCTPVTPGAPAGRVEFRRVSFRYTPETPLIEDLSLRVEPGSTVAIVGPTGAGKTTRGNLLMRFYEIDGGTILLDGTDTATMTRADLRSRFGLVLQDTWLFGGTIAENIAYGAPDATREDIAEAARATCVDTFVRTLPDGYDTVLDDDSGGASAGEKQLITVARAFLARPAVLVLDEATSAVDTRTELLIQRAMATLRTGRTSFVIAHRLSTIRDADLIVVMESGRIVEQGTHDTLLRAGGAYARLHSARTP
ncbi:Lipid A export ATP-binding/permease protein MsbA [Pseudonocardia sp. Ae168_Ps1]|uniref:ABC transporter ATP-binding protein n=1 Tax=unclassified Pseudonocardia TaxID=2619320 RepID=UPI00094ACE92|nr:MULTISPECIES: ABC transporter ATP-binding protein [unclassified Pseudonocardia]OLL72290.1 Lipid A export ATP-binding/permease protein MsbA [Pseudonocardia sp. Ae150A_Ps1]OLL78261.1 Lipid A export ATP-binding/permease protein MsbA [Pseudonocardia sp. Ae168_Ps1]OLL87612.1 Lipid A export ATP-binding/permease protein MsbA [Pseudonocardia sp. Ae263_Ps1]OLL92359.1 Lipid A export ATP-binding/permease protein MsbA [Pseudonocardia sp. Ae356_Ps1]